MNNNQPIIQVYYLLIPYNVYRNNSLSLMILEFKLEFILERNNQIKLDYIKCGFKKKSKFLCTGCKRSIYKKTFVRFNIFDFTSVLIIISILLYYNCNNFKYLFIFRIQNLNFMILLYSLNKIIKIALL